MELEGLQLEEEVESGGLRFFDPLSRTRSSVARRE